MSFKQHFQGKKVLVTGASRGFGRVIVEQLDKCGAKVYAVSVTPENLEKLKKDFPRIETICVDIGNWEETRTKLSQLETMDCVVNNASYYIPTSIMTLSIQEFKAGFSTNFCGVMNICQIFAKKLIEEGRPGSIVNVTGASGDPARPCPAAALCSMCKAAVENMSRVLALELGPNNIRINTVGPALMDTEMGARYVTELKKLYSMDDKAESDVAQIALGQRTPMPLPNAFVPMDKVANSILFLLSDACGPVTGQHIGVDGGYLLT